MEKLLRDNKSKLSADTAKLVEDGIAAVNKVKDSNEQPAIEAALKQLEDASHKAAEELYKTAASDQGPSGVGGGAGPQPGGEEKKKDDVVDAEFRQT